MKLTKLLLASALTFSTAVSSLAASSSGDAKMEKLFDNLMGKMTLQ